MIFNDEKILPNEGQLVFCELPMESGKTAWLIYHFKNRFPFPIVRWVSVEEIEKAEKRINHLENKIKEAQDILASSLNVAGAFIALDDAIGKTD